VTASTHAERDDRREAIAFVDRDGTIHADRDFLTEPDDLAVFPGVVEALRRLRAAGHRIVVVTNQSGIARGKLDERRLARIHERLHVLLERLPDAYLHCPHHPDLEGPYGRSCACRKPGRGLFDDALLLFGEGAHAALAVGDSARDVLPALALGAAPFLVRTGKSVQEQLTTLRAAGVERPERYVVDDLPAAVDAYLSGGTSTD
jgi:histidinol-phosphate phosphatase family protein